MKDSLFEKIASAQSFSRICYGNDKTKKPNEHCYWACAGFDMWGWFESDEHYRNRIIKSLEEKK